MTRTCTDCPAPISPKSTGRCATCATREVGRRDTPWTEDVLARPVELLAAKVTRVRIAMQLGVTTGALEKKISVMRRAGDPRIAAVWRPNAPRKAMPAAPGVDPLADVPRVSREFRVCCGVPEDRDPGCAQCRRMAA